MSRRVDVECKAVGKQDVRLAFVEWPGWDGFVSINKDGFDRYDNKVHSIVIRCLDVDRQE